MFKGHPGYSRSCLQDTLYILDEAVYLMLEYCPAGRLWDVVQPLVQQQLQHYLQVPGLDLPRG